MTIADAINLFNEHETTIRLSFACLLIGAFVTLQRVHEAQSEAYKRWDRERMRRWLQYEIRKNDYECSQKQ